MDKNLPDWQDSLIFTVHQYIERYNDPQFRKFLQEIFDKYVVLFIGYGLTEFELLDFLIAKFESNMGGELKHFILLPFYKVEQSILEFKNYYYNPMGISVLGYEKDEKGYSQLYEVIKNWNSRINQTSTYLYDSFKEIEDVANNYEETASNRILQLIKNDKPQEDFFFKKLASSNNPCLWLKPLKEERYFSPKKNPPPQAVTDKEGYFTIPYWNVLGYLENVAAQNAKDPSVEITEILLDIISSLAGYRNEKGERIENYKTDWTIVKMISTLQIEKIAIEHIEFIRTALKSKWEATPVSIEIGETLLPRLIKSKARELILKLLEVIFEYKKTDRMISDEYISLMDKYWFNETIKKNKTRIAELYSIEAARIAIRKMLAITDEDKSQFNNIWIPTIEDHPQTAFTDRYECQLVRFVRDIFELSDPCDIKGEMKDLLKKEHPIFKRIAIHTINNHYKTLNELFWEWEGNPLDEIPLKHEIYELMEANCTSFSKQQIENILDWIESKKYYIPEEIKDDEKRIEDMLAYRKKEWLSALLPTKDPDVVAYYEKYEKINPEEIDHPGFNYWSDIGWGTRSPIEKVELLNKSNKETAVYLIEYKEEEGWKKPSIEGLSATLRNCVLENPTKFADDMKPFLNIQPIYQHAILWGFSEAWRTKKNFIWDSILNFMSRIVESEDFWKENNKEGDHNYKNWIISQVADLIEEGTIDDNHAFDAKLLPKAEKILLVLAEKAESDLSDMNDLVNSVLNSSKGKIFSAMVNYSLRCARLSKQQEGRWAKAIKEDFNKRLDPEVEPSPEFSLTLGKYLPNFSYLDKKWVKENINKIFLKDNDIHWEAAIEGYLFYSSVVYKNIYFLLSENGHYTKALQTEFSDLHITERLVQHICIGYLEDWEKLDNPTSLISKLTENENVSQLLAIVSFFHILKNKLTDKIKTKVKPIWNVLFELVSQNEENPEYQKIISRLSKWISLIDEIDEETFEWLKLSAKYIQADFNIRFFIEHLLKHTEKTPKKVGEIYIEMFKADVYPEYKTEDIRETIQILYNKGEKETADKICNLYGAKGYDFLRDIYEANRSKN